VWIRHHRYLDRLLTRLVGYRRTFPTFQQAEVYASHFQFVGHQHPDNIAHHSAEANQLRESDYPALFHLAPVAAELRRVFDLGGSVGNLFYSLSRELKFSHHLDWVVYDLPLMRKAGSSLAEARHEYRLRFTDTLAAASGSDLFLASGCLHYFEKPLEEILASLEELARRVLINRTPCARRAGADDEDVITIQDNYSYFVPSIIHSDTRLIESLKKLGYHLRSSYPFTSGVCGFRSIRIVHIPFTGVFILSANARMPCRLLAGYSM
jgi:putative methyltransferase (TIGR04325 family)